MRSLATALAALSLLALAPAARAAQGTPGFVRGWYLMPTVRLSNGKRAQLGLHFYKYSDPGWPTAVTKAGMAAKDKLLMLFNAARKDPQQKAEIEKRSRRLHLLATDNSFFNVFSGAGGPDEIEDMLSLAAWFNTKLGSSWPGAPTEKQSLVDFANHTIGLSCAGFAGSYARVTGHKGNGRMGPEQFISISTAVDAASAIKQGDIMIWQGGKNPHITAIDSKANASGEVHVIESGLDGAINGLTQTRWKLTPGEGGKFHAHCTSHTRADATVLVRRLTR
jgi:hypothetical protein